MVNTAGLHRRSTYEEAVAEVELDRFKDLVKLPDRTAKFILEAPQLQALDPENEEEMLEFERRKAKQRARDEEVQQTARERGVNLHELRRATETRTPIQLDTREQDDFERRRHMEHVAEAHMAYIAAEQRLANVHRVGRLARMDLRQAQKADPITFYGNDDTEFFDIDQEPEIDLTLHTPSTPSRVMGAVRDVAGAASDAATGAAWMVGKTAGAVGTAADVSMEVGKIAAHYGPSVAQGTLVAAGLTAGALYHGSMIAGYAAMAGGAAAYDVAHSAHRLLQATEPERRTKDYSQSLGVRFVGKTANLLLARRAIK